MSGYDESGGDELVFYTKLNDSDTYDILDYSMKKVGVCETDWVDSVRQVLCMSSVISKRQQIRRIRLLTKLYKCTNK